MNTIKTLKALADYLVYFVRYRFKFLISTLITIVSLYIALYTIGDEVKDIWFWTGLIGTIFGGLITFADLRDFRREVDSLDISQHINHDVVKSIIGQKIFSKGGRYYLIDHQVNAAIRKGTLLKPVSNLGKFILHSELATIYFADPFTILSYFRNGNFHSTTKNKAKILVWNDKKVRLETNPTEFGSKKTEVIQIKTTNYFDYIIAGFFSLRKISRNGTVISHGLELMRKAKKNDKSELWSIGEALTAHHIGVSVLLMDAENKILFQKKTLSPGKVGSFAPSGSGSLDVSDMNNALTFQECLINGAKREFREETCWDDVVTDANFYSDKIIVEPLGMSIDLTRGMVTDFFFIAKTSYSINKYLIDVGACKKIDNFELDKNSFGILRVESANKKLNFKCDEANEEFKSGLKESAMLEIALDLLREYLIENNSNLS